MLQDGKKLMKVKRILPLIIGSLYDNCFLSKCMDLNV